MKRWRLLPMDKVIESDDGDYVLHSDYEELEAKLVEAEVLTELDKIHIKARNE